MNKQQRKRYELAMANLSTVKSELEAIRDELQDSMDNMPENFQQGERYETMENENDTLTQLIDAIDDAEGAL